MCVKHIKDMKKVMHVTPWAECVWGGVVRGGVVRGKGYVRIMYVLPKGSNRFKKKLSAISMMLFLCCKMQKSKCR